MQATASQLRVENRNPLKRVMGPFFYVIYNSLSYSIKIIYVPFENNL